MSTPSELPPWMRGDAASSSSPPPPQPPRSDFAPFEDYRPRREAPSGLLIFVGVLSIIYSVLCGAVGVVYTGSLVAVTSDGADRSPDVDQGLRSQIREALSEERSFTSMSTEEQERMIDGLSRGVRHMIGSLSEIPSVATLRDAAMFGSLAQAALLIASLLLLARSRFGMWLAMAACLALIGSVAVSISYSNEATSATAARVVEFITDPALSPELTEAERTQMSRAVESAEMPLTVLGTILGVFMAAWPLVALMILGFSQSVRDATAPRN